MSLDITVVGGGAAGWISAALLDHAGYNVTLMESPTIPIMGVGESTLPFIRDVFEKIGLKEDEWLPRCNGIIKHGNTKGGFKTANDEPWEFSFWYDTSILKTLDDPKNQINDYADDYAYHIAAEELPGIIKTACPNITHIVTNLDYRPECDLLIDCTGAARVFVEDKEWITSDKHIMNSAITNPWDFTNLEWTSNQTHSLGRSSGWQFYVPLKDRVGSGYIYSDKYISDADALKEYQMHMKDCQPINSPRVIKWSPGYLKNPWVNNTVAIGMGAIFIDPLEANALAHIQKSIEMLIKCIERGYSNKVYNKMSRILAIQTSDLVTTYYALSERTDTPFWNHFKKYTKEMETKLNYNIKHKDSIDHHLWPSALWESIAMYYAK
jgi:hypothetical protein